MIIKHEGGNYNLNIEKALELGVLEQKDEYTEIRKHISRHNGILAIKGKKMLKSFPSGDIYYSNNHREYYSDELHFEHTTLGELEKGDVFISECSSKDDLSNYHILV